LSAIVTIVVGSLADWLANTWRHFSNIYSHGISRRGWINCHCLWR
jgi:hypothetical protein